jgi:hypothetical protein
MSLILSPAFGGSPSRPIGVLVAGSTRDATAAMMAAFDNGQHPRLWLCTASGRPETVALLDSIHFDLVVCDDAADAASQDLVDAVRRSPYGGSLLLAAGGAAAVTGDPLNHAVHRVFGLDVPAPRPARPHPIDTARASVRRPA